MITPQAGVRYATQSAIYPDRLKGLSFAENTVTFFYKSCVDFLHGRFWDTSLDVADGDITKKTASLALHEAPSEEMVSSEITISEEHEDTTTETVSVCQCFSNNYVI